MTNPIFDGMKDLIERMMQDGAKDPGSIGLMKEGLEVLEQAGENVTDLQTRVNEYLKAEVANVEKETVYLVPPAEDDKAAYARGWGDTTNLGVYAGVPCRAFATLDDARAYTETQPSYHHTDSILYRAPNPDIPEEVQLPPTLKCIYAMQVPRDVSEKMLSSGTGYINPTQCVAVTEILDGYLTGHVEKTFSIEGGKCFDEEMRGPKRSNDFVNMDNLNYIATHGQDEPLGMEFFNDPKVKSVLQEIFGHDTFESDKYDRFAEGMPLTEKQKDFCDHRLAQAAFFMTHNGCDFKTITQIDVFYDAANQALAEGLAKNEYSDELLIASLHAGLDELKKTTSDSAIHEALDGVKADMEKNVRDARDALEGRRPFESSLGMYDTILPFTPLRNTSPSLEGGILLLQMAQDTLKNEVRLALDAIEKGDVVKEEVAEDLRESIEMMERDGLDVSDLRERFDELVGGETPGGGPEDLGDGEIGDDD